MKPIIVTAATSAEISLILSRLEGGGRVFTGNRETHEGMIAGRHVLLAVTGIGKVNTASAVTALLEHHEPELLINTGCAGAYVKGGLAVGELAIATAEVFGDEGVLVPDGWKTMETIGIPTISRGGENFFNRFPLTRWAVDKALHVAETEGITLSPGEFVTVSTSSGTSQRGEELYGRFQGICENMEGAAAVQVALLYGVDCMEIRGVSNRVEDRDPARWNIPLAVEKAQNFILQFISALCRV